MAGAGTEVGRISIKVTPDTDDFRRKLKQQLEAIEKSLSVKVPAELNERGAAQDMAALMAKLKAAAGRGVKVPVRVDDNGSLSRIVGMANRGLAADDLKAGFSSLGKLAKQAAVGVRDYHREIKKMTLEQQKASPLLNHDLANLRSHGVMLGRSKEYLREFNAALKQQQEWLRQSNPALSENAARWKSWQLALKDANVNATNAFTKFKSAAGRIKDSGGVKGFLSGLIPSFREAGDEVEKSADRAGRAGRTFLGLSRIGWIVGAVFAGAAPAVGLIAGLIAGLPSLMMTFGAAAGAIAMGLDGIKAAAQTVAPQWDAMRASISQRFQDGLTPIFASLAEKVFPVMETGMLKVTDGLLNMGKGITGALTSAQGLSQLETIFTGIGGFFTSIGPSMGQFTQSFLQLGAAGANSMGHLTDFIATFASQWQGMVDRVTNTPVFDNAMQGMSQALPGFTGLFTQLMESGLGAMAELGAPLQNMFQGLGNFLSAAMPGLSAFAGLIGNTIGQLGNALAPVMTALAGPLQQVGSMLTEFLGPTLQQLSPIITQVASNFGTLFVGALQGILPVLSSLVQGLAPALLQWMQQLSPILPVLAQAFQQIGTAVAGGLQQALPVITQAFLQLIPVIIQLIPVFQQIIQAILPLIPAFFNIATAVLKVIASVMPLVSALLQASAGLAGLLAKAVEFAAGFVSSIVNAIAGAVSALAGGLSSMFNAIANWVTTATAKVREFGPQAVSAITGFIGQMTSAGADLIKGLINGIGSMIGAAVSKVKEVGSAVVGAITGFLGINSPSKVFTELGEFTMEGFNNGLAAGGKDAVAQIKDIAKAIFEAAKEVFGNAGGLNLAFNMGGGAVGLGGGGFNGLSNSMTNVASGAKEFQSNITGALNPAQQMTAETKQQVKDLSQQLAILEMQRKELELQKVGLGKGPQLDAIKARIEEIRQQKLAIGLQKDQLTYAQKYEGSVSNTNDQYQEQIKKLANMPVDFAKTTASTALNDLGIPGQGALGALADWGMDAAQKFVFNVSNVDEAMAVKDRETSRQSMGMVGR